MKAYTRTPSSKRTLAPMIDSGPLASSHLVTFLYTLIRDHLPFGAVEQLVDSIEGNAFLQHRLSESHIAAWAESVAARLTSDSTLLAIREYARRGGGDTTIIRVPLTQLPDWARAAFEEFEGSPQSPTESSRSEQPLAEHHRLGVDREDLTPAAGPVEERIDVAGGKYTVILRPDGSSTALRYGEPWPAFEGVDQLDNLTTALARDLQEARQSMRELGRSVAEIIGENPDSWPTHGNVPLAVASYVAILEKALTPTPLGGQHSTATEFPGDEVLACVDDAPATGFPLLRLFELLDSADSSSRMKERVFMGWQNNTAAPMEIKDLVERLGPHLHDLQTHYRAWRDAIKDQSESSQHTEEDRQYWAHELKAFDRLFVALAGVTVPA